MRVSDLQNKMVISQNSGKNLGKIIDIDILENGTVNYFVVEPKRFWRRFNFYNNETNIRLDQIIKIGEDVILVEIT